jgi:hypothetical protein
MRRSSADPTKDGAASPQHVKRRSGLYASAVGLSVVALLASTTVTATVATAQAPSAGTVATDGKPRTIITTDGEQDDQASMIRYLMYSDEFDTVGLVYTSSQWHWAGDGKGTLFTPIFPLSGGFGGPNPPVASYRWLGTTWIQEMLGSYAQEYPNLKTHDANYPTPQSLLDVVHVGNIDFPGEMSQDTDGSDFIKAKLLDNTPGPLYLQAWGGLNTIARALESIKQEYQNTPEWTDIYNKVSAKAVIQASGFQDTPSNLFTSYLVPNWPDIKVNRLDGGYSVWAYTRINRQPVENQVYYSGAWMKANIIDQGPLGAWEYTYGDGRGGIDPGYSQWNSTAQPKYTFVSEGDNVAFLGLIPNGLNRATDPTAGGWGGRLVKSTTAPNEYVNVASDTYTNGTQLAKYDWSRWFPAQQLDFAARMKWGVTPAYADANHAPVVSLPTGTNVTAAPGDLVNLNGQASDPDGNQLTAQWWQYKDAGTYPGTVTFSVPNGKPFTQANGLHSWVTIPSDAQSGQTIQLILQVTDNGTPAMTSYQRVTITIQ